MLTARWRILRDRLNFSLRHSAHIMSLAMKLHNFCIEKDGVTCRRSWESVNETLQPQELAELDADRGRFVREMRELNRCVLDQ